MRDYSKEFADRVQYIRNLVEESGVDGIVFGNSGGKDSALVGILCKFACENTVGIMMPCASKRNFEQDMKDAKEVAEHFGIESRVIDLTDVRQTEIDRLQSITTLTNAAVNNIAPRLRMTTLYAVAASEYRLVAAQRELFSSLSSSARYSRCSSLKPYRSAISSTVRWETVI